MRMRSTGLGKRELVGHVQKIERKGDTLLVSIQTTEPVRWHVRVLVDYEDVRQVMKTGMNWDNISFLMGTVLPVKQRSTQVEELDY
ncbi:MAG: hypothetical protein HYY30_08350 [Chloroflexi bacterium]|nr:hypothetical protein [Chloroflexota bacterium]